MSESVKARLSVTVSMLIFGTIGILRKFIPMPSGTVAFARGLTGALFLILAGLLCGRRVSFEGARTNAAKLLISGALLGFNWILLFEAYRFISVSAATLCYYMAPVIIILLSPIVFKEKLTVSKALCATAALTGMILVSGAGSGAADIKGVLLALTAALFYALIVMLNKSMRDISPSSRTVIQLAVSAAALLPYIIFTGELSGITFTPVGTLLLITAGIVHTGLAYLLYFGSLDKLPAQTAALLSYIDPVTALLLAAALLGERLTPAGIAGAFMIIGAMIVSELKSKL